MMPMDKITLTIDSLDIVADKGTTILGTALQNGIYIPHLCYHPDLKSVGACRLCLVEVNGQVLPSCLTPVEEGMGVKTKSSEIDKVRRAVVELLIANHHSGCRHCPATGKCELQKIMAYLRLSKRMLLLKRAKEEMPLDTSNPVFDYDPNRCILCGICVRTCEEIAKAGALNFLGRGYTTKVAFSGDKSRCESCGECVVRCPVGALIPKKGLIHPHLTSPIKGEGFYA